MPYGFDDDFANTHEFALNPKCLDESHLWLMRCPMVCLFAVEWHLPHRVMS
jgi:hypothetical protein